MSSIERGGALKLSPPVNAEQDHVLGPADAPITLVEYGDFECPFCGRSYPAVRRIGRELGDRLRFVFRHFRVLSIRTPVMPRNPPKRLPRRATSGRCMTSCSN